MVPEVVEWRQMPVLAVSGVRLLIVAESWMRGTCVVSESFLRDSWTKARRPFFVQAFHASACRSLADHAFLTTPVVALWRRPRFAGSSARGCAQRAMCALSGRS